MKAYEFVQAMNEIDDKYIDETLHYKKRSGNLRIWRAVAIAACVCLAATLALAAASMNQRSSDRTADFASDNAYFETASYDGFESETGAYKAAALSAVSEEEIYEEAAYEEAAYEEAIAFDEIEAPLSSNALYGTEGAGAWSDADAGTADIQQNAGDKIIYNVYLDMETNSFDESVAALDAVVTAFQGYSENQSISNYSRSYRNASFNIRIPAENLDAFLEQVGEICTVTYINRSADDVSESYYDIESRLTTAKAKLQRLQELMAEAENMEDIINLEDAISDVQWEIDSYSGSLQYYDSRISYSTVTVNISEVYEVVVEEAPLTFGERLTQAFDKGIRAFGNSLKDIAIWIVNSWIWLIILAIVVVAVILIIRKVRQTRSEKKKNE